MAPRSLVHLDDRAILGIIVKLLVLMVGPVFYEAREKCGPPSALSGLKQVGLALAMYTQDWDDRLPPMESAAIAKEALFPYVKNDRVFLADLKTEEPFQPNPALSHKKLADIREPETVVAFYAAHPLTDRSRNVAFADGRAKQVPAAAWAQLKQASGIP
jgi:hypothetical protein